MRVHVMTNPSELHQMQDVARRAADLGLDGLVVPEATRTAYLSCAAAALADTGLEIATGIALAFPRSPMVSAVIAWELAEATGGRFRLGLGTQVKAHIERRYGSAYHPPGPRLRDHVLAVRAAFAAFRGEPLAHAGPHYDLSLLPRSWSPGSIAVADPPIDVAAVNPWMLRLAGEVADGVHLHPLNTQPYFEESVFPNLTAGAARADRPLRHRVFAPAFLVLGASDEERHRSRERIRRQIGFYGSTPNYAFIFDQLGRPETTARLRAAQAGSGERVEEIVDDELLASFVLDDAPAQVAARLRDRFAQADSLDVTIVAYLAGTSFSELCDEARAELAAIAAAIRSARPDAQPSSAPA